ncbi:MAG: hypothetical protein ACE5K1_02385 [Acidiferrobacterales bacterium]
MLRFAIFIAAVSVLLAGCQTVVGNENSVYYRVPVDSTLVLTRTVMVPAKHDRIYFRKGKMLTWDQIDQYQPYCVLQLFTKKDVPQTVKPGEFVVQKVYSQTYFQLAQDARVHVARFDEGGIQEYRVVVTVMELFSNSQPDVLKMKCGKWGLPQDISNVTINMIRQELAGVFSLELAEAGTPAPASGRRRETSPSY